MSGAFLLNGGVARARFGRDQTEVVPAHGLHAAGVGFVFAPQSRQVCYFVIFRMTETPRDVHERSVRFIFAVQERRARVDVGAASVRIDVLDNFISSPMFALKQKPPEKGGRRVRKSYRRMTV